MDRAVYIFLIENGYVDRMVQYEPEESFGVHQGSGWRAQARGTATAAVAPQQLSYLVKPVYFIAGMGKTYPVCGIPHFDFETELDPKNKCCIRYTRYVRALFWTARK